MKFFLLFLLSSGLIGLLVYTNPTLTSYEEFVEQQFKEETLKQRDPLINVFGSLFGGLASSLIIQRTVRHDYVLFSTYDTTFDKEHLKAVGMLNNFFIQEKPDFKSGK